MSGKKLVTLPCDTVYLYDGSLPGLLCCVFESVYKKELPAAIQQINAAQPSLYEVKQILTDDEKAARVGQSIEKKISTEALELVQHIFLSAMADKELAILRFLILGYQEGAKVLSMLWHMDVAPMLKTQRHLFGERHLLLGFVRFTDVDGKLVSTITPKNFILPFIADHFTSRYAGEDFLIFDKTHKAALLYSGGQKRIIELEELVLPEVSEEEARYRALWKQFYNTVAIEERENPRCRMSHMPKRYWENMIEVQDLL